uniref:Galectin n=1 Tax=Sinocyclocheilus grahami TaxID=75366 RepID=A0A672MWW5_SINGR
MQKFSCKPYHNTGIQNALFTMQSIPYVSRISGGLKAGKAIFIQGSVPSGCESFVVNLKCGESEGDDIAFQIKPQFSSNRMVLNSRQHGSWGKEEKLELPLKQASGFDLIIAVNSENYQVCFDAWSYSLGHRISLDRVIALSVGGQVSVTNVAFTELAIRTWLIYADAYVLVFTAEPALCGPNFRKTERRHGLNLPYVGQISGGLKEGMALYLQGVFPTNADQFELNFKTGPSDNDDIAFHFNPRMDQKVVMNSFRNGGWEAEESVSDNPFIKGQPFEMFIVVKSEGYVVYVNGKELCTFKHRIPLEKVAIGSPPKNENSIIIYSSSYCYNAM